MRPIIAIARKDLKLLFRDWTSAFFTFLFPLLLAVFFGIVFSGTSGKGSGSPATITVVDESGGPMAKSFTKDLDADEMIEVVAAASRDAGESMVREGKAIACVILAKDFDDGANSMFSGGGMEIEALVDPARRAESGLLTGKLTEIAFRQLNKAFTDPAQMSSMLTNARAVIALTPTMDPKEKNLFQQFFNSAENLTEGTAGDPDADGDDAGGAMAGFSPATITVTELASRKAKGPANAYAISFPQGVAWGLMGCVMSFASGLAQERTRGTLLRLAVAPISRAHVLLGKALGCFIACLMVMCLLIVFAWLVLGVTVADPLLFGLAAVVAAFGFTGIMMLLAGIFRTEGAAEGAGRACILILAMIGGGTIPLFFMPPFLQTASSISPFKWAIFAIEGAIWRGLTFTQLAPSLGALMLFGVIGFVVGGYAFSRAAPR
ncbi:MAG: ABC transporter permease [Phycisphaerae bacterium]|nr:ABC transporter permease [Phycisphaerae bacterium]